MNNLKWTLSVKDETLLENVKDNINTLSLTMAYSLIEELEQKEFGYFYLGVLNAKHNKIDHALALLEPIKSKFEFVKALITHIEKYGNISYHTKTFSDSKPYEIAMQSKFFNNQKTNAIAFIVNLYKTKQLGSLSDKYLVDIGPGDGTFLIDLLTQLSLSHYKILLIEPSEEMLKITSEKLEKNFHNRIEISSINKNIQDVLPEDISFTINSMQDQIGLTIASLSIHHMVNKSKLKVLEFLHTFTPKFVICEISGNHEAPENSPKLLLSCLHLYEELISGVVNLNDVPADQKWLAIDDFLLSEALRIIGNSYDTRIDYHIKKQEWIDFAETVGFKLLFEKNTYLDKTENPLAYALAFSG